MFWERMADLPRVPTKAYFMSQLRNNAANFQALTFFVADHDLARGC
jgi:hypothetical protein